MPIIGGDGSAAGESVTLVQDTYRAFLDDTTNPGLNVFYGGAVRLSVTVLGWKAEMKLSLPMVAAKVEGEGIQAAYRFEVLGLKDTAVLAEHLPTVGEFTPSAYLSLLKSTQMCAQLLVKAEIDPVKLFVAPVGGQVSSIAYSYMHVLRWIALHGAAQRPDVDASPNDVDIQDWVIDEVWTEARNHKPAEAWAKAAYNRLASNFDEL